MEIWFVAKEWPGIAKKSQIQEMEVELKKLLEKTTSIYEETSYLRQREEETEEPNSSTYANFVTFIFLSIMVCSSVAALQVMVSKGIFRKQEVHLAFDLFFQPRILDPEEGVRENW